MGYKASAEQFAPRELVEPAEAHGMDSAPVSDHFQPWRHVAKVFSDDHHVVSVPCGIDDPVSAAERRVTAQHLLDDLT